MLHYAHEQHIFTSNLKRQILLDSIQGRAPNIAFLPICSLPEVETWIETWSFSETIHSRSYTHIIRNVYPDPSFVFDKLLDIESILETGNDIAKYYDHLIKLNNNGRDNLYEHKKALWMCLMAANALEGVRFYVSFACSWAFAELKKMEGNAKIIKLIARDENLHLASTTTIIKELVKEDKDFAKIQKECEQKQQSKNIKAKIELWERRTTSNHSALVCIFFDRVRTYPWTYTNELKNPRLNKRPCRKD